MVSGAAARIGAFAEVPFLVVDLETTGSSGRFGDRVIEVGAVLVHKGRAEMAFETLVNPDRPIPWHITRLTGIDDAMVRDAPRFADIAGDLAWHIAGRTFVAHNAGFDWGFLKHEYARVATGSIEGVSSPLCTVRLARRLLNHLPRRNLDAVCWHYGVVNHARHRAGGDAMATGECLLGLLADAERRGVYTLEDLRGLVSRRTSKRKKKKRLAMPSWSDGMAGA